MKEYWVYFLIDFYNYITWQHNGIIINICKILLFIISDKYYISE